MKYLFLLSMLFIFPASQAHASEICGIASAPDSLDGTLVEKICFNKNQIDVYLRSGQQKSFEMTDFDPEDGEGVNTLTFADSNGSEFSLQLITDEEGNYVSLKPIDGERYPFTLFLVNF